MNRPWSWYAREAAALLAIAGCVWLLISLTAPA